ncbi:hypothetical protein PV350_23450 [Streptomyces sp. PA03-6a]|nr:hypothetical protein [Streptomyces sp. PA03-6a]
MEVIDFHFNGWSCIARAAALLPRWVCKPDFDSSESNYLADVVYASAKRAAP